MNNCKKNGIIDEQLSGEGNQSAELSPDMVRREFLKRFGVYAAGSAIGMYVLMSARTSKAGNDSGGQ